MPDRRLRKYVRVFRRKTVLNIFSRQIDAVVLIILQIFLATRAIMIIGEYHTDISQF